MILQVLWIEEGTIQVEEVMKFANDVKEISWNLENENVQIDVFGDDVATKEGDFVKRSGLIVDVMREDCAQVCSERVSSIFWWKEKL